MNRLLITCLFVSSIVATSTVQAQSVVVDSLQSTIDKPASANGERIEAMEQLAKIMAANNQPDEALQLIQKAQQLSLQEQDGRYSALVLVRLSALYAHQDSLSRAFQAIDSAQWYVDRTEDRIAKGRVIQQKAWLERHIENTDKAYQHYLEALRILEGQEGASLYQCRIYHSLAAIHAYWGDTEKQQYYTRLCLDAALKSNDPDAIANAYLSMGANHLYRFRKTPSQRSLLDSSKYYNLQVLKFIDSHQNRITTPNTGGIAALNMANLYFEFYPPSYKDSAQVYLAKALDIGKATNSSDIIANSYGILSEYALNEKDYDRAENLLQRALSEVATNPGSTRSKSRISNVLSRVAEQKGDAVKALKYYKQYMQFDKELFDEEKFAIAQRLEAQYQSEKKELALKAARQEAAFTKKLNRYYLVLIAVGVLGLFFLFRSYHFKLKASQQRHLLLVGEKNKAELQANLRAEETARLQAERKLMQERLDRLEKELLAGTLQVEEKNTLIQELKEKLDSLESDDPLYRQMNRLIAKSHEIDKGYSDIKAEFAEIRPELITGLQEKAENKLTQLDLKYCSYILMGLTNKEIAFKLNIDPKSIRMARYRIKQKLKLEKTESLDKFISDLQIKPDATLSS